MKHIDYLYIIKTLRIPLIFGSSLPLVLFVTRDFMCENFGFGFLHQHERCCH